MKAGMFQHGCTAAGMRILDQRMRDLGMPELALMEGAGRGAAALIAELCGDEIAGARIEVWCGPGNNGGDGYAVARHLDALGVAVRAVPVFAPASEGARVFGKVAEGLGLVGVAQGADVVVDAVFGNGQRPGARVAWPSARVVVLDVPTGVDPDTGEVTGDCPEVSHVVSIGAAKPFLFTGDWLSRWSGAWSQVDLGYGRLQGARPDFEILGLELQREPWLQDANKWTRGHVGVVAGSPGMEGAAALVCLGAFHGGAGLVTLYAGEGCDLRGIPAEVLVRTGPVQTHDALVVGPGLGRSRDDEVRELWRSYQGPAVWDADALRVVNLGEPGGLRLLTPHAGEAAAWLGVPWRAVERDRFAAIMRLRGARVAAVLKGACPLVTGAPPTVAEVRSPALGTAGSGDVFAGLCGAELARSRATTREQAEVCALWATDRQAFAATRVKVGALASDIARALTAWERPTSFSPPPPRWPRY